MTTCRTVFASFFSLMIATIPAFVAADELPDLTPSQRDQAFPRDMVLTSRSAIPEQKYRLLDMDFDEAFRLHPTLIYVPNSKLPNGKRGLLLVLHGCGQTNIELWKGGELDRAASHGLVIAAPSVNFKGWPMNKSCWDYDISAPASARGFGSSVTDKVDTLIDLAKFLAQDKNSLGLDIDPSHVYVTGLSSGGTFSLLMGCRAPALFAGVGAIAGPAMGSSQFLATTPKSNIRDTAGQAEDVCESLAIGDDHGRPKDPSQRDYQLRAFHSQIANISFGDRDRDGVHQGPKYDPWKPGKGGSYSVASTEWSQINAKALANLYLDTERFVPVTDIHEQEGQGQKGQAKVLMLPTGGKPRVALVEIADVGHAWPAGGSKEESAFIANKGLNYPDYIARWFLDNNVRAQNPLAAAPFACSEALATAAKHLKAGHASEMGGLIYARGSNQPLGTAASTTQFRLAQTQPGFFQLGLCQ